VVQHAPMRLIRRGGKDAAAPDHADVEMIFNLCGA
jgi:hypothetical protein